MTTTEPGPTRRARGPVGGRALFGAVVGLTVVLVAWWTASVFSTDGFWPFPEQLAWRFTARWAALVALLTLLVTLSCIHLIARRPGDGKRPGDAELSTLSPAERARRISAYRRIGVKGLVVGGDGRVSTSKVQVAIWSGALVFGLLLLLFVGRSPNCPLDAGEPVGSCPGNEMSGVAFADLLGSDFRWEYLLLLGWPVAVAVAAKKQVLRALDEIDAATGADTHPGRPSAGSAEAAGSGTGADIKTPPGDATSVGLIAGLRELVSDDEGRGSLLDIQYLAFTSVTVAYFVLELTTRPERGMPEIPAALLVLMGIAGGGYLSGKVIDPIGAKSDRGAPPPPVTPGTSEAAPNR